MEELALAFPFARAFAFAFLAAFGFGAGRLGGDLPLPNGFTAAGFCTFLANGGGKLVGQDLGMILEEIGKVKCFENRT